MSLFILQTKKKEQRVTLAFVAVAEISTITFARTVNSNGGGRIHRVGQYARNVTLTPLP